jgi:flagellar biogenesis protein FliO
MQAVGVQARAQEIREGLASSWRASGLGRVWPLLERLGVCRARSEAQLEVLETISLGGRRQLFLIACGGERYLVGAGAEGVGSMLRVGPVGAADTRDTEERV